MLQRGGSVLEEQACKRRPGRASIATVEARTWVHTRCQVESTCDLEFKSFASEGVLEEWTKTEKKGRKRERKAQNEGSMQSFLYAPHPKAT